MLIESSMSGKALFGCLAELCSLSGTLLWSQNLYEKPYSLALQHTAVYLQALC